MTLLACRGKAVAIHHYRARCTAAARRSGRRRQQQIEQTLFRVELGPVLHLFQFFFTHHVHGDLDQVADHRFHIPPDIPNLGEFRGLHLHEG
jgi:hypothetical protein